MVNWSYQSLLILLATEKYDVSHQIEMVESVVLYAIVAAPSRLHPKFKDLKCDTTSVFYKGFIFGVLLVFSKFMDTLCGIQAVMIDMWSR